MTNRTSYNDTTESYTLVAGYGDTEKTFIIPQSLPDVEFLAQVVSAIEYAALIGDDTAVDWFEDFASDIAEDLEVVFVYTTMDGSKRTYSPLALWEASACEWEQSSEYGYTHGWDI